MELVSDTYAGDVWVRNIVANYKKYRFFFDESLWMYCVGITIFYILVHSIEYEKTSKWGMYRAALPIKGRESFFKIYFWLCDHAVCKYFACSRKYVLSDDDNGQNRYLFYQAYRKKYMVYQYSGYDNCIANFV